MPNEYAILHQNLVEYLFDVIQECHDDPGCNVHRRELFNAMTLLGEVARYARPPEVQVWLLFVVDTTRRLSSCEPPRYR